jgi:hypothetical protein
MSSVVVPSLTGGQSASAVDWEAVTTPKPFLALHQVALDLAVRHRAPAFVEAGSEVEEDSGAMEASVDVEAATEVEAAVVASGIRTASQTMRQWVLGVAMAVAMAAEGATEEDMVVATATVGHGMPITSRFHHAAAVAIEIAAVGAMVVAEVMEAVLVGRDRTKMDQGAVGTAMETIDPDNALRMAIAVM